LTSFKRKLIIAFGVGLCVTIFGIMAPDHAGATENQEQVVVSPAQQAVNTALATATTEVQQAITATETALVEVTNRIFPSPRYYSRGSHKNISG
jgi:hypothetical protein